MGRIRKITAIWGCVDTERFFVASGVRQVFRGPRQRKRAKRVTFKHSPRGASVNTTSHACVMVRTTSDYPHSQGESRMAAETYVFVEFESKTDVVQPHTNELRRRPVRDSPEHQCRNRLPPHADSMRLQHYLQSTTTCTCQIEKMSKPAGMTSRV